MPRWAGELVHCVGGGIVRCQEPLSSPLKCGVDVVRSVRGFSLSLARHKNNEVVFLLSSINEDGKITEVRVLCTRFTL